ncbi:alpha/beta fold hydrolase [Cytobacillus firmus]|uniref:alpha/beta fold hydrolase n=1 Tax=Cytobacillus firmus TaxID=1399 RepID=UPI0021AD644D|nr:alpha/beta hydrolase [Cytobacillus firmus]
MDHHHYIEREEGFTLHYLEWIPAFENDSLPVICIHGNLSNGRMFRWIGEKLSQGRWGKPRRVISNDLRGCGDSGLPETGFTIRHLASDY